MPDFDPDAYLSGGGGTAGTAIATVAAPPPPFDPDQYLRSTSAPTDGFDPNEYLKQSPPGAPEQSDVEKNLGQIAGALKTVADKIGIPTSLDDIRHELDLLGLTQPTAFPLPRAFPEIQKGAAAQVNAAIMNFPADIWNFLTSPAGVALGGASTLGPVVQRAMSLGFTADQIRAGLQADNLQDQVEAALGAGLLAGHAAAGEIGAKPEAKAAEARAAEAVSTSEMRAGAEPVPGPPPEMPSQEPAGSTPAPAGLSQTVIERAVDPVALQAANAAAAPLIAQDIRAAPTDISGFSDSPLVQFIRDDVGGIISKSAAAGKLGTEKFQANASMWDDAPAFRSPRHNQIYNPDGVMPDQAAQAAADAGLLPQGADASALWQALQRESDSAHRMSAQVMAQRANERTAFTQDKNFTAAAEQPVVGEKPIRGADLNVGDEVKVGTEMLKVTDIDPDTYDVTLEDGSKYGIQHVANDQALYGRIQLPDPAALADRATRETPGFELAQPESVAEQQARLEREGAATTQREGIAAGVARPLLFGKEDIFGFGPGAAAAGEPLRVGSQIAQLTNTVADALKTDRATPMQSRLQRAINAAGGKVVTARETVARGFQNAKATWIALKNGYLRPPIQGDFKEAVKDWQGADQRTSFEVRQFVQKLRDQIKDPIVRDGITNYIQADGNADLLKQRASASNIKYRPGYEAALNLNDAQKTLAANVRQYFDAQLQDGINAGVLDHGIENYINQMWKRPNKFTRGLQADLQAAKLQTNFQFARKRIFDSFFDGEQAGYAPASKDVSALVAAYDLSFNRSLAARAFVKSLRESKAADGEPVTKFSGMTQPIKVGESPPEAYLIRSRTIPEGAVTADGRKYQIVDHPALRGWKYVVQDEGKAPAYYQADMLVHPDYAPQLRNILGSSAFRSGPLSVITSPMLKAGAIAKQTKLSLSIFHLDQEGLHGLFHRVNPANLERINFDDPTQWSLVRNGLQVADYSAMELFSEGLRGGGLVSKIPILGRLQNNFNEFLFKDYIPRLKMTMALHAFDRNVARYPGLSPDVVAELTARQANAAFGELNYKLMGRNPTLQDFLRLTVLAPDFLEARSRFVGQALKPYGAEQRTALLLGAATMYVTARALNQWLDNDPHWGKPFSVVYNGREYRLRTVMGDAVEAFTDPRRFFYNRFSPWLKIGVTVATGRDYRGLKLSGWEQVKDVLSWFVPIPASRQDNANIEQRALGSAGVSNKPAETAIDQVYKSAIKFKEGLTDPKVQAEVRRAQQETTAGSDYSKLNRAILDNDKERATNEIVDLLKSGKDATTLTKFYSNLPNKPFTGSQALESQFLRNMSPVERARYQSARNQQINMSRTFFSLFQNAMREYRQPK